MRTVNIGELRNQLSACLQHVRNGEEIVIRDRDKPIARILPFVGQQGQEWQEDEARLVAAGIMKIPEQEGEMDWDEFFSHPVSNIPNDVAVKAALNSRGDR